MEKKGDVDRAFFSFLATVVALMPTWLLLFGVGIFRGEYGMMFFWMIQALCLVALVSALYSAWFKRRK